MILSDPLLVGQRAEERWNGHLKARYERDLREVTMREESKYILEVTSSYGQFLLFFKSRQISAHDLSDRIDGLRMREGKG